MILKALICNLCKSRQMTLASKTFAKIAYHYLEKHIYLKGSRMPPSSEEL